MENALTTPVSKRDYFGISVESSTNAGTVVQENIPNSQRLRAIDHILETWHNVTSVYRGHLISESCDPIQ